MSDPLDICSKTGPGAPTRADWLRYVALIIAWGSAFSLTRYTVSELTPTLVVTARIWIAVVLLWIWMMIRGHKMPKLFPKPDVRWYWLLPVGATGASLPFMLNTWALQHLDSGLVGILLATMPLCVAALSHFTIPGGHFTWNKTLGLLLGLLGIVLLVGPGALNGLGGNTGLAQFAVLAAAVMYAINAVIIHFMPETPPSVAGTGMLLIGGIIMLPFAASDLMQAEMPSVNVLLTTFFLGLVPTGVASILYMQVIKSAGPGFIATSNYFIPPFAVFVGVVFLQETPSAMAFLALAVISLGLFLERRK